MEMIHEYWKNTNKMPAILRMYCQGGMLVSPIFLILIVFPITNWNVNGRLMSHSELWSSGTGPAIFSLMVLTGIGAWGLAARLGNTRWGFVFSPIVPPLILLAFSRSHPTGLSMASVIPPSFAMAALIYTYLFHMPSVKNYLKREYS